MSAPVVIVGAGLAAYAVARELRKRDRAVPLLLITGDDGHSYAKPMLSNAFALGKHAAQLPAATAAQMAEQLGAVLRTRTTVLSLDSGARLLHTSAGAQPYARLVLATGAAPIRLPLAGAAAAEVLSVNHLDDYARLRARLDALGRPARVAILGAGLIGCEFADDLAAAGHRPTLVDPNPRLLAALAAPGLAHGLAQAWEGRVALRLGTVAEAIDHAHDGYRVQLADGSALAADLVLAAVGLRPQLALAQAAGLATGRGIAVDAFGATSAPHVYALGDGAEYQTPDGPRVLPYVAPLLAAARAIGATLAGTPTPIAHRSCAVVVKTPSYRMALLPPPPGTAGRWHEQAAAGQLVARFRDPAGVVRGFGLSHPTPAQRQGLQDELGHAR